MLDVADRRGRARVGAVAGAEGGRVALRQAPAVALAVRGDEPRAQVVVPRAGQFADVALERLEVDVGQLQVGAQEEVEADERLVLAHGELVVDVAGGERAHQVSLDPLPHLAVEAVARQAHHDREPAAERIGAHQHAHAALPLEAHDRADLAVHGRGVGPEQVGARQRVEHGDDLLVIVRPGDRAVELEHLPQLEAQDRHLVRRHAVGLGGQQAEEALLAQHLPAVGELLDADVIHARRPVHGGLGVRLGDHQRRPPGHAVAQAVGEAFDGHRRPVAARLLLAQDAEPRAGLDHQRAAALRVDQVVPAVAEEHEVPVLEPLQEGRVLLEHLGLVAVRPLRAPRAERAQVGGDRAGALAHRAVVVGGEHDVAQGVLDRRGEATEVVGIVLAVDEPQLEGLGPGVARGHGPPAGELDDASVVVAHDREDRMQHVVHREPLAAQLGAHRVDHEGAVGQRQAHDGALGLPTVGGERRVDDVDRPPRRARRRAGRGTPARPSPSRTARRRRRLRGRRRRPCGRAGRRRARGARRPPPRLCARGRRPVAG